MADILVELKSEKEKDKPEGSDKDMPMENGDEAMKSSQDNATINDSKTSDDAKMSDGEKSSKKGLKKNDVSHKDKSSLRRTLEKMMGKKSAK